MHSEIEVGLSTHLGRLWAGCSERQCHYLSESLPAYPAHRRAPSAGWLHSSLVEEDIIRWQIKQGSSRSPSKNYLVPCLFNIQNPLWPVHGSRIDWLTLFTFSDDGFHCDLRDPRGNLSHKIKCPPHTRMTALSVNNLELVNPKWAHGHSVGRLYRPSVPFNCIKPPLRHSSQSICLILARFDQGHIHRQHIFFHQFYYRVKPQLNKHLACGFGSYPALAGKGVLDPFMDTGRISKQMQGCRLPEDCQVYSFKNGIEFRKVNMFGVLFWV